MSWSLVGILLVGVVAGFLNTLAGGGSLLTLPALMLMGLPAQVANGTNRLGVFTQSAASVWGFAREGRLEVSKVAGVLMPTSLGTVIGAAAASQVPAQVLEAVLLGTLMTMAVVLTVAPAAATASPEESPRDVSASWTGMLGLFAAGLYGGFVQAGVGFVLLWVLGGALRYDLVRGNAMKAVCTLVFGSLSLLVFAMAGQVAWAPALALALGSMVGGRLGVSFAVRAPQVIRWVVLATVLASCFAAWWR